MKFGNDEVGLALDEFSYVFHGKFRAPLCAIALWREGDCKSTHGRVKTMIECELELMFTMVTIRLPVEVVVTG